MTLSDQELDAFDVFGPSDEGIHHSGSHIDRIRRHGHMSPLQQRRLRYVKDQATRSMVHRLDFFNVSQCNHILSLIQTHLGPPSLPATNCLLKWSRYRHDAFPTTDIPVSAFPQLASFLDTFWSTWLADIARVTKYFEPTDLKVLDAFVVYYEAPVAQSENAVVGRAGLEFHTDGSLISFNVLLNSLDEFQGGGTLIRSSGAGEVCYQPTKRGEAIVHDSKMEHAGREITGGRRVILVGFIDTRDSTKFRLLQQRENNK